MDVVLRGLWAGNLVDLIVEVASVERCACSMPPMNVLSTFSNDTIGTSAAQPGIAADRFAREIVAILKSSNAARSPQLNAKPLGASHHRLWQMHSRKSLPLYSCTARESPA